MLRPRLHLSTHRPSPTTVAYTVSTASSHRSLPSHFIHAIPLLLRLVLLLTTLLTIYTYTYPINLSDLLLPLHYQISSLPSSHIAAFSFVSLFVVFRRFYTEESLLILSSLGIQTTTLSSSYLLPANTRFIPTSQIRDIFIHEAFKGFEVRFYLAVVVEGEGSVVVVFPNLLPNRAIVEEVWRGARECLYGSKG